MDNEKFDEELKMLNHTIEIINYLEGKRDHCWNLTTYDSLNGDLCQSVHYRLVNLRRKLEHYKKPEIKII